MCFGQAKTLSLAKFVVMNSKVRHGLSYKMFSVFNFHQLHFQDIRDFLEEDFKHPNLSKALALDTLTKNISLTPEEAKVLAEKIVKAVNELKGVPEILNESRKDYLTAINLKKEALRARYVFLPNHIDGV